MSIGAETAATFNVYRRLVGASLRTQLQFRTSLVMETIGAFAIGFTDFVEILVIFSQLPSLGTWSVEEVAFLYGSAGIGFALCDMLVGSIERTGEMVRSGRFDTIMLRPAGTLVQIAGADLALRRLGKLLQAIIVFSVASSRLHIEWDPRRIALVLVMVISGALIYMSVFLATAAVQFWLIGGSEFGNALTYGGSYFTSYPLPIFGSWLRRLLAYVIPLAFCAYLPALAVLDKPDELGLPAWLRYASPGVAMLSFAFGYGAWRFGVRHYRSTGS
jgi:ABC-2 type transport system permease protein